MINVGELRKGIMIELDGQLFTVVEFEHIKMGRGGALARLKMRNVRSGYTFERTFSSNEKFKRVYLERQKVQFLYREDSLYQFMDTESFEQMAMSADQLGEDVNYLKEGTVVDLLTYNGESIAVELPVAVELKVVTTDPGFKGDTATAGTKPATLETGAKIHVPLFVNEGDIVKVDTRSGTYLERAG